MEKPILHIVKIGGKLINDPHQLDQFLGRFAAIKGPKILIHGGGRKATELAAQLGLETKMIHGRRITDAKTLEVAVMVYAGLLNKTIIAKLQHLDINALGLTGADANVIQAHKRKNTEVDFGYVGDIDHINFSPVKKLIDMGITPVLCAITHDLKGQLLNTNADTMAARIAIASISQFEPRLSFCFEYPGVLKNANHPGQIYEEISKSSFDQMIKENIVSAGMIPKLSNGFDAAGHGIPTRICGIDNLTDEKKATSLCM